MGYVSECSIVQGVQADRWGPRDRDRPIPTWGPPGVCLVPEDLLFYTIYYLGIKLVEIKDRNKY